MWVGSGYQKEADTIGFWYKLLIAELPFEKIRTRQISSEAESSSTPVSQCPPSVSEQVSWCPLVPGSVTIPNSSCHDPTFPLNELQPTAAAGRPTLHFLCIPDYLFSFVSLWEAPLQKSPHLFGQFNQPKPRQTFSLCLALIWIASIISRMDLFYFFRPGMDLWIIDQSMFIVVMNNKK